MAGKQSTDMAALLHEIIEAKRQAAAAVEEANNQIVKVFGKKLVLVEE